MGEKNILQVFGGDDNVLLKKLYAYHFDQVPSNFKLRGIDALKLGQEIFEKHKQDLLLPPIVSSQFNVSNFDERDPNFDMDELLSTHHNKKNTYTIYVFKTGEILEIYRQQLEYYFVKENLFSCSDFEKQASNYALKEEYNNSIYLLVKSYHGLEFNSYRIKPREINIELQYNDDFKDFDHKIKARLNEKANSSGLILLHGKPGTGKTTYIRNIINSTERPVIFIPSGMADELTNPQMLSLLEDKQDSVIVIEDAEKILMSRELEENNHAVSTLLNLTDGLLADVLNITIICTFNTDIRHIDNALLRPGRLIGKYEFKELSKEKAQILSDSLGYEVKITRDLTLTEIYNGEFEDEKKQGVMGFK